METLSPIAPLSYRQRHIKRAYWNVDPDVGLVAPLKHTPGSKKVSKTLSMGPGDAAILWLARRGRKRSLFVQPERDFWKGSW